MGSRAGAFVAGAVVAASLLAPQPVEGQDGPPGPPKFPPGLHDRTLPPQNPFAGGDFTPPGHGPPGQASQALQDPGDADGMSEEEVRVEGWTAPAASGSTPTAFGASLGQVWAGASYQPRARRSDGHTGAAGAGFGLGNPRDWVGLDVGVYSFSTMSSGFGNRGGVDIHLHRLLPGGFALAAGWESAHHWGGAERDSGSSRYAVASKWLPLRAHSGLAFSSAALSLGVGDGRFLREADFHGDRTGANVFGSASVRVLQPLSVLAEWTGQDLMLGTSVAPLRSHSLVLTAGVADMTGAAGDGARFVVGLSHGHDLLGSRGR